MQNSPHTRNGLCRIPAVLAHRRDGPPVRPPSECQDTALPPLFSSAKACRHYASIMDSPNDIRLTCEIGLQHGMLGAYACQRSFRVGHDTIHCHCSGAQNGVGRYPKPACRVHRFAMIGKPRRDMVRLSAFAAALMAMLVSGSEAHSCTCTDVPDLPAALAQADVVFLGIAAPSTRIASGRENHWLEERTVFEVIDIWKGNDSDRLAVASRRHPRLPTCGLSSFEAREQYLVFAVMDNAGTLRAQQHCSRTARSADAAGDLLILDQLRHPGRE